MSNFHVMHDLETAGTVAGCQVFSIGAVRFAADGLHEEFYAVPELDTQIALGLTQDPDTMAWWADQTEAARVVLTQEAKLDFREVLTAYRRFLKQWPDVRVWGNGSDFDNAIVAKCYKVADVALPWKFWHSRCYRTLKSMSTASGLQRVGTYHNALDDAKTQAAHLVDILHEKNLWCCL